MAWINFFDCSSCIYCDDEVRSNLDCISVGAKATVNKNRLFVAGIIELTLWVVVTLSIGQTVFPYLVE